MASGDRKYSPGLVTGEQAGTGAALTIDCRFKPALVEVYNKTGLCRMVWTSHMADDSGFKSGAGARSVISGSDIKGSANTNSENADAASLPTNGALLKAADTFATYTSPVSSIAETDVGRNVGIFITNDSGGALDLFEGVTTFTVTGTYKGAAQTESITFTSTSGNKSVANSKYRYKYGSKPFDTITTVSYTNAPAATLKLSVGIGSKIGLPNGLLDSLEASVEKITKNGADLAVSGTADLTNNTVNLGTLSDNDDFQIVYRGSDTGSAFVTSGGITPTTTGFTIGTDVDLNVSSETLYFVAHKL